MSITLTTDPIMDAEDAQALFGTQNETQLHLLINSLTEKFKHYTNRIQLGEAAADLTEYLRARGTQNLYLHATPVMDPGTHDVICEVYNGDDLIGDYKFSDSELAVYSDNREARVELHDARFPAEDSRQIIKTTYRGGWASVPGDVLEGAVIQGRIDLKRMAGEAGVTNRSKQGEGAAFETGGLIQAVKDLWTPYRIVI